MNARCSAYRVCGLLCLLLTLSGLLTSQSIPSTRSQTEASERINETESIQKREQWFLRGRDGWPGQSAATLHRRAVQQKLRMRAVRSQKLAAAAKLHPALVPGSGAWTPLGPAPVLSDGNAYRQVTGLLFTALSCGGGSGGGGGGGGGGTGGTPAGSYTITVTGTPASVTEPSGQSVKLQVN